MQFNSIQPIDGALSDGSIPDQSGPGSNGNEGGAPHSPKPQHHWNLTIRLLSVISGTLISEGGGFPLSRCAVDVFYGSNRLE